MAVLSGKGRPRRGIRGMPQVHVHGLQLIEFFQHPGPILVVSPGRTGSATVVVESENIASEVLRRFRVVALQLV
jgi:hypothetical protein